MLKTMESPRFFSKYLSLASGTIIIIACFIRIFFSADLTDEGWYISQVYTLFTGGKLFVTDLFLQQTASIICYPFYFCLLKLFPKDPPLILYGRLLFFIMSASGSYIFYRLARNWLEKEDAFLISSLCFTFVPFSIPNISYNTIGTVGFNAILCLLGLSLLFEGTFFTAISALVSCISIIVYPTLLVPVYFAILLWLYFLRFYKTNTEISQHILVWIGAFTLILFPLVIILTSSGLNALVECFFYTRDAQYNTLGTGGEAILEKLKYFLHSKRFIAVFSIFAVSSISCLLIKKNKCLKYSTIILGDILISIFSLYLTIVFFISFSTIFIFLTTVILCEFKENKKIFLLFTIPSIIASVVFTMTSSNTLRAAAYGFFPLMLISIVMLLYDTKTRFGTRHYLTIATRVLVVLLGSFITYKYYTILYRESYIINLTSMIEEGPYKGVFTTKHRKKFLSDMKNSLDKLEEKVNNIAFFDNLPFGYSMTNISPKSRALFQWGNPNKGVVKKYLTDYYLIEENRPDAMVVATIDYLGKHIKESLSQKLLQKGDYRLFSQVNSSLEAIGQPAVQIWIKKQE